MQIVKKKKFFFAFHLYFLTIPKVNYYKKYNKLMSHIKKYPIEYIIDENNITQFYKNIGLIYVTTILVWFYWHEIENLRVIAKNRDIKKKNKNYK